VYSVVCHNIAEYSSMYHDLPGAARFWSFLFAIDQDLAETARKNACPCGGYLHCVNYLRKPWGTSLLPSGDPEPVSSELGEPARLRQPCRRGRRGHSKCSARNVVALSFSYFDMWRFAVSPASSVPRTKLLMNTVVGWATARSPATGYGAGHDRLASSHIRSSEMSRWRCWIRAWGRDEPVTCNPDA